MCGILAVFNAPTRGSGLRALTLKQSKLLRHRGPDSSGVVVINNNAVAHERLAIVDISSGAQPFVGSVNSVIGSRVILSVNGEIYNHEELKNRQLVPYEFTTNSDCEIILAMYIEVIESVVASNTRITSEVVLDCFMPYINQLRGMFAFVIYDPDRDICVVVRDHLGIIPLYYGEGIAQGVWFSSEMKALTSTCIGIQTFPPGSVLAMTCGGDSIEAGVLPLSNIPDVLKPEKENTCVQACDGVVGSPRLVPILRSWYRPEWKVGNATPLRQINIKRVSELLERAVGRCLMSDVPWGVLLSGGLDSSLIAALASEATRTPIHSFTIGLAVAGTGPPGAPTESGGQREPTSPDLVAAQTVATHLGTIHHSFTFSVQDGIDVLPEVIYHLETYDVTSIRASIPMYLLSRYIKSQGIKMILTGEGADEIFGGYLYFHKAPSREEFQAETVDKLNSLHLFDCNRANKATSAWGVEARVPFLDPDFVEYCMSVDPVYKMSNKELGFIEKFALRSAFTTNARGGSALLPPEILWRQKEQFSDGVGYGWIDGLKAFAGDEVSDAALQNSGTRFPHNSPQTKEAYLYRSLFEDLFPVGGGCEQTVPFGFSIACSTARAQNWCDSFKTRNDPSGRCVTDIHSSAN